MNNLVFKYCPPIRIDIISDLKIRLSQPPVLNDPFENLQLFDLRPENFRDAIEPSGFTRAEDIRREVFRAIDSGLNLATNRAIGDGFGVVSFSRTELSLLMWSHYAKDYSGFVLGFDTSTGFFSSKIKGLTKPVQDVVYTSKRKAFQLENMSIPNGLLCTKPLDWSYEEEVRLIDSIEEEEKNTKKDDLGFPIVLRPIPIETIREIIVGPRSVDEAKILKIVENRGLKVVVYKLYLDETSYRLVKRKIS